MASLADIFILIFLCNYIAPVPTLYPQQVWVGWVSASARPISQKVGVEHVVLLENFRRAWNDKFSWYVYFDFSLQLYCASTHPLSPEGRGRVGSCIREFEMPIKERFSFSSYDMNISSSLQHFCNYTVPVPRPLYQKVVQGPAKWVEFELPMKCQVYLI